MAGEDGATPRARLVAPVVPAGFAAVAVVALLGSVGLAIAQTKSGRVDAGKCDDPAHWMTVKDAHGTNVGGVCVNYAADQYVPATGADEPNRATFTIWTRGDAAVDCTYTGYVTLKPSGIRRSFTVNVEKLSEKQERLSKTVDVA